MNRARDRQRQALVDRCRTERHELIAATATVLASHAGLREAGHWWRMARRALRVFAAVARSAADEASPGADQRPGSSTRER
jgi:hypothetical protein